MTPAMLPIEISIDYPEVAVASLIVNGIAGLLWALKKIRIDRFLLGRWEGEIFSDTERGQVLNCILIVSTHTDRENSAMFYYSQTEIGRQKLSTRGVDRLVKYERDKLFIHNKQWKATFVRSIHVKYDENYHGMQIDDSPAQYLWDCKIVGIWTKPKMDIKIQGNDVTFSGVLHKH